MNKPECLCDVCGRSMELPTPPEPLVVGLVGTAIGVSVQLSELPGQEGALKQVYPEIEIGRTYSVCYACYLKSLGIRL